MLQRLMLCVAFTTLFAGSRGAMEQIARVEKDNTAFCRVTSQPPAIDGQLGDPAWRSGQSIMRFMMLDKDEPAIAQTWTYLACDAKGLYIAFRCFEPEMIQVQDSHEKDIFLNDSVEIFIDADRDRNLYHHFVLDVKGRKLQETGHGQMENINRDWSDPWDAAVFRSGYEWTAEVLIPWKTLGFTFREGAVIRANFGRNRPASKETSSWNLMPGGFHQPLLFGNVILGRPALPLTGEIEFPADTQAGTALGRLAVSNVGTSTITVTPEIRIYPSDRTSAEPVAALTAVPGAKAEVPLKVTLPQNRLYDIDVLASRKGAQQPEFLTSYHVLLPQAPPEAIGAVLSTPEWGAVWEANATSKVMPDQKLPGGSVKTIQVTAAKNEFEPFQVVLTPTRSIKNLRVSASDLKGAGVLPSGNVSVKLVETVPVTIATSPDCVTGDYPDPLPIYKPMDIPAGRNTALWFTVHVPSDAKAGDYTGTITLAADETKPLSIPVRLHVWNFALPEVSHLRTAYGHDAGGLAAWHGAKTLEEKREITRLLNQNFIEHRISPYNPMAFSEPKIEVKDGKVTVDWTDFDRAASMFLPHMNAFNLPYSWMSDFLGTKPGTPEYRDLKGQFIKQMARHLREKGWFDKGYIYIWDEPEPDTYQKIADEAKMWHDADPGYQVLLTEQPEKPLADAIDIYVPILPNYNESPCQTRQKAGDQIWWYVCCGPHHPFPNNFIDYPAIDHRILHWMNWKYGVTGVLYWQTQWWQDNPWTTPMSYTPDHSGKWGNGDGHLLYPALRQASRTPLMQGPVDSIRWEMIREGVEDYDYLHMLHAAVGKAEKDPGKAQAVTAAKKALAEVDTLVFSRTDYDRDPAHLYAVRKQIAEALEALMRDK